MSAAQTTHRNILDTFHSISSPLVPLTAVSYEDALKNRWNNIVPVEATRVRLSHRPGYSDYINANYVHLGDMRYIATQAPLANTIDDFWRMCWEQDVRVIVMLCNLMEQKKVRCHRYWPVRVGEETHFAGGIAVALLKTATLPGLQLRRFQVRCANNNAATRVITQLHYTEWPDFGVPEDTEAVRCIAEMFDYYTRGGGTGLVHCSAGIGRTGTFIAIHSCLRDLMRFGYCDVRAAVESMRRQRVGMVQTEQQFLFIHLALRDAQERYKAQQQQQEVLVVQQQQQQQMQMQQEQHEQHQQQPPLLHSGLDWNSVRLNMSQSELHIASDHVNNGRVK